MSVCLCVCVYVFVGVSVAEVVAIEKKVEQGAIGLTFNSSLTMRMRGPNLNSSPMTSPIGYVHVALLPL